MNLLRTSSLEWYARISSSSNRSVAHATTRRRLIKPVKAVRKQCLKDLSKSGSNYKKNLRTQVIFMMIYINIICGLSNFFTINNFFITFKVWKHSSTRGILEKLNFFHIFLFICFQNWSLRMYFIDLAIFLSPGAKGICWELAVSC